MTEPLAKRLLGETLRHASEVPYYLEAWRSVDPRLIADGDVTALPLTDKATFNRQPNAFVHPQYRDDLSWSNHTSGTTGRPTVRLRSAAELEYSQDVFSQLAQKSAERRTTSDAPVRALATDLSNGHGSVISLPSNTSVRRIDVRDVAGRQAALSVLEDAASSGDPVRRLSLDLHELRIFTEFVMESGVDARGLGLDRIDTTSHYLPQPMESAIRDVWGSVNLCNWYGLSEIFGAARWCSHCGMHHLDPFVFGEVLDLDSESPIVEGIGVLCLTELYPFTQAQPLIRYWTGDLVEVLEPMCSWSTLSFRYIGRVFERRHGTARAGAVVPLEDGLEVVSVLHLGACRIPLTDPAIMLDTFTGARFVARNPKDPVSGRSDFRLALPAYRCRLVTPDVVRVEVALADGTMNQGRLAKFVLEMVSAFRTPLSELMQARHVGLEIVPAV